MARLLFLLLLTALLPSALLAQAPERHDSIRVIVLSDVAVSDKISRLVVASGKYKRGYSHVVGPGGGNAVRFSAPRGGYHQLSQILVHLETTTIKEGQLRVRAASIAADGTPADDDLLPSPAILTNDNLRNGRKRLTLAWPTNRLVVPEAGFFLVVESSGASPDDYISKYVPAAGSHKLGQYEIRRRDHPETEPRLVNPLDFPKLMGAEPGSPEATSWERDASTRKWRNTKNRLSVIFIEAVFE